jgi:hypothetical protein
MIRNNKYIILIIVLLFSNGFISAQNQVGLIRSEKQPKWLVGIKFSTFGIGIEGRRILSNKFHLRGGISYLQINYPLEKVRHDMQGEISVSPSGLAAIFDYWPHKNIFLSAGTIFNFTKISISGKLSESVMIGDIEMLPDEVGHINADLFPGYFSSPYLGFGFGQNIAQTKKISFIFETGILFHGRPKVKLNATGMLTPTASAAQETIIEENIAPLSIYPTVSISCYYNFLLNEQ